MKKMNDLLKMDSLIILQGGGVQDSKLIDDFISFFEIKNYKVYNIEKELLNIKRERAPMVLCTYDKGRSARILKQAGIRFKRDYVLAEDLFSTIDLDVWHDCRKLYVYVGIKEFKKRIKFYYKLYMIMHHICREDIERKDESIVVKAVRYVSYAAILKIENIFRKKIVFTKNLSNADISKRDFICIYDHTEEKDAILYQERVVKKHNIYTMEMLERYCFASRLLRQTYFDRRQNQCGCVLPYEMFYINPNGHVWLCPCFGELTVSDLITDSPEEAWNSSIARIMRLSIENNTYTFCDRRCQHFWKYKDREKLVTRKKIKLSENPEKILVSFDRACNLKCRSCRMEPYVKNCETREKFILYYADMLNKSGWLEACSDLTIGGDGETFMSRGYKKVLFEETNIVRKSVNIMTNGTLFTPKIWEQLEGKYEYISMSISIDAMTADTYSKVRGGNFKQLMKNMEFLSGLRKQNLVNFVTVKMIVQEDNYREMKDFVLWAKDLGFDQVYLSPMWNWGTYSDSEFRKVSIFMDKEETEMKLEVKECLKDEIFLDPIVLMRWRRD